GADGAICDWRCHAEDARHGECQDGLHSFLTLRGEVVEYYICKPGPRKSTRVLAVPAGIWRAAERSEKGNDIFWLGFQPRPWMVRAEATPMRCAHAPMRWSCTRL